MTDDEARAAISSTKWYHGWEIRPGIESPGPMRLNPQEKLSAMGVPDDLTGRTAIDIGTYDGALAFALEQRGAVVTAADVQFPDRTGFNVAHQIIGSKARYVQCSVYELSRCVGPFDVVLFCGVYYHLKHPVLAFEELGKISHDSTRLFIEGECLIDYAETLDGTPMPMRDPAPEVPICLSYPGRYKGVPNWFIPNVACVRGWLACGGYRLENYEVFSEGQQRLIGAAVRGKHPLPYMASQDTEGLTEHPVV